MRTKMEFGPRALKQTVAAFAFLTYSTFVGYAAQFGDFTYVDHGTYVEITDYPSDAAGDVVIPNEIVGKPVTSIGNHAFYYCHSLTSITIPDSVTSIGDSAFRDCSSLSGGGQSVPPIGESKCTT